MDMAIWLVPLFFVSVIVGEGFVEEVSCSSESLTVMLNKSYEDIREWISRPTSQPVAYVYGYKARTPCGIALKGQSTGTPSYNFTIPYGKHCNVLLSNLEPNYMTAETTIAIEDNNDVDSSKPMRINHVFCLYTRKVETVRFNDVSTGHEVIASTGGRPKPKVEMLFRTADGRPVKTAKFGDTIGFYLALSTDTIEYIGYMHVLVDIPEAYKGINPKHCMFSNNEKMDAPAAKHLTFVQNSCPVNELIDLIDPLSNVNEEVYYSKFKTFRFGNQTTVFAHCTIHVCLNPSECDKKCYKRVQNSNLTAERLRYRYKRSAIGDVQVDEGQQLTEEVSLSNVLTILDEEESLAVSSRAVNELTSVHCQSGLLTTLLAVVSSFLLLSVLFSWLLIRRLQMQSKPVRDTSLADRCSVFGSSNFSNTTGVSASCYSNALNASIGSIPGLTGQRPVWIRSLTSERGGLP